MTCRSVWRARDRGGRRGAIACRRGFDVKVTADGGFDFEVKCSNFIFGVFGQLRCAEDVEFTPAEHDVGDRGDEIDVDPVVVIGRLVLAEEFFLDRGDFTGDRGVFEVVGEFGDGVGRFAVVFVVGFFGVEGGVDGQGTFEFGLEFPTLHHGVLGEVTDEAPVTPGEDEQFVEGVMCLLRAVRVSKVPGQLAPDDDLVVFGPVVLTVGPKGDDDTRVRGGADGDHGYAKVVGITFDVYRCGVSAGPEVVEEGDDVDEGGMDVSDSLGWS